MINTQYGSLITPTTAEKTGSVKLVEKEEAVNNEATKAAVLPNVDRFEHSIAETTAVYSPKTIGQGVSVNSITPTTTRATTDYQRENIFKFLAAKIAGLRTDSYGTPYINRQSEVDAYTAAKKQFEEIMQNFTAKANIVTAKKARAMATLIPSSRVTHLPLPPH